MTRCCSDDIALGRHFPVQYCLEALGQHCCSRNIKTNIGQHCRRFLPVQSCPKSIKTTLKRIFSCAMLPGSVWANIPPGNNLCKMLVYGVADNIYEENNLYNVVSIMLGQHCIGILTSQCCPNFSETTLYADMFFLQKNNLYNVVLMCLDQHYTRKLPVQYWPMVNRQLFLAK